MIIGVPREIKPQEGRVGIVPDGVGELTGAGHEVLLEAGAGLGAGFDDGEFAGAGAEIVPSHEDVFARAEMILKIKEPLPEEYGLLRPGQVLFCYLHLAAGERLTRALVEAEVVGIAFETVETEDGAKPLLAPMSMVAGHLATLNGAEYLQKQKGGRGVLLGGEVEPGGARVLVFGAGVAGTAAALAAAGLGADVTVVDIDEAPLRRLAESSGGEIRTLVSKEGGLKEGGSKEGETAKAAVGEAVARADLVVGAVLVSGARAPHVVTRGTLKTMKKGAVIVDVAIDQGGCVETSRPTTHSDPVFEVDGVIHYCVANMPGSVPVTATRALARLTLPLARKMADRGWREAMRADPVLAAGLNVCEGKVALEPVAKLFGMPYLPAAEILAG